MQCFSSAKFTMTADILHQTAPDVNQTTGEGSWQRSQDPITGQIVTTWVPADDDPNTPDSGFPIDTVKCMARGIIMTGLRSQGSGERFGANYENINVIHMWLPPVPTITISLRDRVTNIRDRYGNPAFVEYDYETGATKQVLYDVLGVTPMIDPFNRHIETFVQLERAVDNDDVE